MLSRRVLRMAMAGFVLAGTGLADEPKDMDGALAVGRPLAAGRLAKEALQRTGNQDLNVLYQAGDLAAMSDDVSLALSRFRAFVEASNEKGPRMRRALGYVLARGVYPEGLTKYLTLLGADEHAWRLGKGFLDRCVGDGVQDQAVATAELLIQHYATDAGKMDLLAQHLGHWGAKTYGKDEALQLRLARAVVAMSCENMLEYGRCLQAVWSGLPPATRLEFLYAIQKRMGKPMDGEIFKLFAVLNELPEAERPAAGKAFLGLEPIYRDKGSETDYRNYVWRLLESPAVFHVAGAELVNDAAIQQRLDLLVAKVKTRPDARDVLNMYFHRAAINYLGDNRDAQIALYQKHAAVLHLDRFRNELVQWTDGKQLAAQVGQWVQGEPAFRAVRLAYNVLDWYNRTGDSQRLAAAVKLAMLALPGDWDVNAIATHFMGSGHVTNDVKVAVLQAVHASEGSSPGLRALVAEVEKRDTAKAWAQHAGFNAFKAAVAQDKPAADPARVAYLAMKAIPQNPANPDAAVYATAEAFLKAYTGKIPGSAQDAATTEEWLANRVLAWHVGHVLRNKDQIGKAAVLWGERVTTLGGDYDNLIIQAHGQGHRELLWPAAKHYAALIRQGQSMNRDAVWRLWQTCPVGESVSLFDGMYDKLGNGALAWINWLMHTTHANNCRWPFAFYVDQVGKVQATPGLTFGKGDLQLCIEILWRWSTPEVNVPEPVVAALTDRLLAASPQGVDGTSLARLYGCLSRSNRPDAARRWFDATMAKLQARPVWERANALFAIVGQGEIRSAENRAHMLLTVGKPLVAAVPPADRDRLSLDHWFLQQCAILAGDKENPARQEAGQALYRQFAEMALTEGQLAGDRKWAVRHTVAVLTGMVERGEWARVNRALDPYTAAALEGDWNWGLPNLVSPVEQALEKAEAWELLFTFASLLQGRVPASQEQVVKACAVIKMRAARNIEGVMPVDRSDPTYDLYLAAHMLRLGSETRAWTLTQPKLDLLREKWQTMEPAYVAWAIDRLRVQDLHQDALDFAFTVLLKERDFDPEVMARVSLAKGDTYRDQENFQAARIEYQGLLDNSRYKQTEAGLAARYRLIALMIQTKDYAGADARLQRLVDMGSLREQAEAFFLYAQMAFDQNEYTLARDHLRDVFRREHGHVPGRLLEGELRLILPRGLSSTEVAIGRLDLQTVAVPGRELTLKMQDRNLSVARGGKAIPVRIRTTRGGDQEDLKLLVSPDDESLFIGTIATRLGAAQTNNLVLELMGDEEISYQIDPVFQKANEIDYPPKRLLIKSDAELVASSGEIFSREEREKLGMERQIAARSGVEQSAWQRQRRDTLVRPGSPIHVQVTDLDRSVSAQADSVTVRLATSSGDVLEGFPLTETGPHTGVFVAEVPTAVPYPMATASDTEEGKDPNTVINNTRTEAWVSVADGKLGKWVELDTMSSHAVQQVTLSTPDAGRIRRVRLLGGLEGDLEFLAEFPHNTNAVAGGMLVENLSGYQPPADQIRSAFRRYAGGTAVLPQPAFSRPESTIGKRGGWFYTRLSGVFWLPENRFLTLKFLQPESPGGAQHAYVFIDGEYVLGGGLQGDALSRTAKRFLAGGAHRMEVLLRDHWENSQVIVGFEQEDGSFAPMPEAWFSTEVNPGLATLLRPRAVITQADTGFAAAFAEPVRLRRLRWVFDDFDGQAVSATEIHVVDDSGAVVIPSAKDFTMGRENRVLEVAAGDAIEVTYVDEHRLDADLPELTARLGASFANAEIKLAYEHMRADAYGSGAMHTTYMNARRGRVGDRLMLVVADYDEDRTDARDTVDITVTTSSGETLAIQALETRLPGDGSGTDERAGTFMQILTLGETTGGTTIKLRPGDTVTATYLDRENTDPGVPFERQYAIVDAGPAAPEMELFRTRIVREEDRSPRALLKAERLRRQGIPAEDIHFLTDVVQAEGVGTQAGATSAVPVSANGPVLVEVIHPAAALHAGSRCVLRAVSGSEQAAAAAEGRAPRPVEVPMALQPLAQIAQQKGFAVRLTGRPPQAAGTLLDEGRFAGVLRLQLGSPGDKADERLNAEAGDAGAPGQGLVATGDQDERFRVPTIVVAGNDVIHISLCNEAGETLVEQSVALRSDAIVQLMDRSYSVPMDAIHLGQQFYVQVRDPDRDTSDQREVVELTVSTTGGDRMPLRLQETLPHSGIFSGTLKPVFVDKDAQGNVMPPVVTDDTLQVQFGETVTFSYTDALSLGSDGPTNVVVHGRIHKGADGREAVFTKRFKDPEMAVRTQFLLAEALFEMAKDQRKLKQEEQAAEGIAEGKRILEEAMRDYPDTSQVAQGEFLLANLAQELENYQEAIGRYSRVISSWPDSEYASRSQFRKAICLEKMEHYEQSCEEYVKLTYLYPNSPLVADATVRLGNFYYTHAQYRTAGRIFERFQDRHPEHELAVKALFLAGQSYMKMESEKAEGVARDYGEAIQAFARLVETYPDDKEIRPEAMYWLGDSCFQNRDYVKAYQTFKKLTWDYPATKWAKIARGRLTERAFSRMEE